MTLVLHPGYFLNIANFAAIVQNNICWEVHDNYQKQTFRNRCYIATDIGMHMLNIPIKHEKKTSGKQKYSELKIDNSYQWQRQHWRTLQTAYRTSPFFEFYEDELAPLFENEYKFLMEYNLATTAAVCDCLQIKMPTTRTSEFKKDLGPDKDGRFLILSKKEVALEQPEYVQVFDDRHHFIKNLSILDLLFNEGPNALSYLKSIHLTYLNA
ncbi:WbqC-like protein family protein [Arenibacter nanhaiticus]|uniref:WbqC-like protein family protein n=1 Tax=Arenibacter nanhaiticus TaxID=558155 RepID=A0A1M6J3R9_9FLAO|nr:WbqC family protein [Arenibacter nanhaiticus]SHJ41297.1 WbqC-like protein family protein [Arenibacter nanhaiticus]